MAYQMTVTLTEQEYQLLAAEAAKKGKEPETLLRDMIQHLQPPQQTKRPMTDQEFMEKLYREGEILNLSTPQLLTPEEQAEQERLRKLFATGKPLSEMIIEDRGPY